MQERSERGKISYLEAQADGAGKALLAADALDSEIVELLHAAVLSPDRNAGPAAIQHALLKGIAAFDLADFYIPAVSHLLGEQWCSDQLGFANVTIGAARLQSLLRDLGPDWVGDWAASARAPVVLLIVSRTTHHTLGAMVLAGQLRRRGLSVQLVVGAGPEDVALRLAEAPCDAVLISAAVCDSLENLRQIVNAIKKGRRGALPTVIGGSIVNCEVDVAALTGADLVTSDPEEALGFCIPKARIHASSAARR